VELTLALLAFFWAAVPAAMLLRNLRIYQPAPERDGPLPGVSVLIPARNEEKTIGAAVAAVLSNEDMSLEVIVLDDGSTDATALVVEAIAAVDDRTKIIRGAGLPAGWCGKQHACAELARHAVTP
jgi:cellulose synthase/poly-beta-1,6-N-acetylglucosamine synthase-like glycosyltransferase